MGSGSRLGNPRPFGWWVTSLKKNEKHDFEAKVMSRFGEKIIFPFFLRGDFQVNQDVNLPVET